MIVFVVVLSNCILLSIDKMSTPVLYGSLMHSIRKTISDEKDFHCSANFKKWVIKFKFLHSYCDWEFDLKAPFQMRVDKIQAIISEKEKENTKIFMHLKTLAKGMARTQDYEKQKSNFMFLVQKNNQEIILHEMIICDYQKAYRIALSVLGMTKIVGTALKQANVILAKIQECEKEIDDLKKQEKDELEKQEKDDLQKKVLMQKTLCKKKTRKFVFMDNIQECPEEIDVLEKQEKDELKLRKLIQKGLRKQKNRNLVITDIEEVQDPLSQ